MLLGRFCNLSTVSLDVSLSAFLNLWVNQPSAGYCSKMEYEVKSSPHLLARIVKLFL